MKILQLVTKRQYRGAEVFAANLSTELIRQGQRILFVGLYKPGEAPLLVEGAVHADLLADKRSFISLIALWRLVKLIREEKPEIIQANGSDTLKYALAARVLTGYRPVIYRNISIISTWMGNSQVKKKLYTWLFNKVDHVSSVGNESRDDFKRFFAYPDQKIAVIRRGIPLKAFDREKARAMLATALHLPDDIRMVMHVGNFSKEKNHTFLLEVFTRILKNDDKIKLFLIGNGEEYQSVVKAIHALGLQDTVYLLGFRSDIENIVPAADVFVLCSHVEGVPGVILEAASYKVPSLAVNVGGVLEVVKNNETGILLENHDVEYFTNALLSLLADPDKRLQLGANAYRYVTEEYNPEFNARKFIDLYHQLKLK